MCEQHPPGLPALVNAGLLRFFDPFALSFQHQFHLPGVHLVDRMIHHVDTVRDRIFERIEIRDSSENRSNSPPTGVTAKSLLKSLAEQKRIVDFIDSKLYTHETTAV